MRPTVLTMARTQGWNGDGAGRSPVPTHKTVHVTIHPDELLDLDPVPPPRLPTAYVTAPPAFEPAEPSPTERHLKRALAECAVDNDELRGVIERAVAIVERQRGEADAAALAAAALPSSPTTIGRLGPNSQVRVNRHGSVTITGALFASDGEPPFAVPSAAEGQSHFVTPLDGSSGAGASAWGTFGGRASSASPAKRNLVDVPGQGVLDLLPGWKVAENTAAEVEEDRYYFYNAVTKKTLWDAPFAPAPSAALSPPDWRAERTGATRASAAASPSQQQYQANGFWVNGENPDELTFSGRARRTGGDAPFGSVILHEGEGSGVSPERRAYMQMQTGDAMTQYATGNEGASRRPLGSPLHFARNLLTI